MRTHLLVVAAFAAGCSMGYVDNNSGGSANLPTLGAGPFEKPTINFDTTAEEPYVVVQPRASLFEPTVLGRDDGGFRIWYSRQEDDSDEVSIFKSEIPSIYELPDVSASQALVADEEWEQGRVGAPAITELPDGSLLMLYEGGMTELAIGVATSTDGGASWSKSSANPVILDAMTPGVSTTPDGLMAVFVRPGDDQAIYAADASDPSSWTERSEAIIEARPEEGDAFDLSAVMSPNLRVTTLASGRAHYGLHFGGIDRKERASIGFAASFDGETWVRFAGIAPVLAGAPPEETGAAWLTRGPVSYLFFSELKQLRGAIAVGVHPNATPP